MVISYLRATRLPSEWSLEYGFALEQGATDEVISMRNFKTYITLDVD